MYKVKDAVDVNHPSMQIDKVIYFLNCFSNSLKGNVLIMRNQLEWEIGVELQWWLVTNLKNFSAPMPQCTSVFSSFGLCDMTCTASTPLFLVDP